MLAYIPYMDPMGNGFKSALQINVFFFTTQPADMGQVWSSHWEVRLGKWTAVT